MHSFTEDGYHVTCVCGRGHSLTVSVPKYGLTGPGSNLVVHCAMFLDKTLNLHRTSLCLYTPYTILSKHHPYTSSGYKWVLKVTDEIQGGNLAMDSYLIQGGVMILLVTPDYGDQHKLQLDWPWLECRIYLIIRLYIN